LPLFLAGLSPAQNLEQVLIENQWQDEGGERGERELGRESEG